jgi:hypothetical protein
MVDLMSLDPSYDEFGLAAARRAGREEQRILTARGSPQSDPDDYDNKP